MHFPSISYIVSVLKSQQQTECVALFRQTSKQRPSVKDRVINQNEEENQTIHTASLFERYHIS